MGPVRPKMPFGDVLGLTQARCCLLLGGNHLCTCGNRWSGEDLVRE